MQRALPEMTALFDEHPIAMSGYSRVHDAIAVQQPTLANKINQLTEATVGSEEQLALLEDLKHSAEKVTINVPGGQYAPELVQRAGTKSPVDMVSEDGSVLEAGVVLFCDGGCEHFFEVGETWHGCVHNMLCDGCYSKKF